MLYPLSYGGGLGSLQVDHGGISVLGAGGAEVGNAW